MSPSDCATFEAGSVETPDREAEHERLYNSGATGFSFLPSRPPTCGKLPVGQTCARAFSNKARCDVWFERRLDPAPLAPTDGRTVRRSLSRRQCRRPRRPRRVRSTKCPLVKNVWRVCYPPPHYLTILRLRVVSTKDYSGSSFFAERHLVSLHRIPSPHFTPPSRSGVRSGDRTAFAKATLLRRKSFYRLKMSRFNPIGDGDKFIVPWLILSAPLDGAWESEEGGPSIGHGNGV